MAAQTSLNGADPLVVVIALGVTSALTFLLARLGARGRLSPHGAFGIRTKRTLASDHSWYHVHREAAGWLVAAALILVGGAGAAVLLSSGTAQFAALIAARIGYVAVLCSGVARSQRTIPDNQDRPCPRGPAGQHKSAALPGGPRLRPQPVLPVGGASRMAGDFVER